MHCTDNNNETAQRFDGHSTAVRRRLLGLMTGLAALAAGCAAPPASSPSPQPARSPAPVPAAPQAAPATVPAPAPVPAEPAPAAPVARAAPRKPVDLGPAVKLPPAPAARNWDELRKMAARRMVTASPKGSYMTKPPPLLFGIPVLEIELNADGSLRDISVTRPPANIDAQDTIDYAIAAIERAAPFGDISKLPKPWKFTEVFLFNNKRQFKPRSLD